ncbi:MAG: TAT-variant-translocated molybdopterin oxidoreductase [Terriglobales bacterium]
METDNKQPRSEAICPGKLGQRELLEIRDKLASDEAPEYWRSLAELAQTREFKEALHREFPKGASEWLDEPSRRGFLKLMGVTVALAGLTSCIKQPMEPIVPYVRQPEELTLGVPRYYATAMTLNGYACPQLVTSREGRPTKIEGNPEHPASLGGSDIFSQAAIYNLYDPDRSESNTYLGEIRPWMSFLAAIRGPAAAQKANGGAGLRFLTPTIGSPTVGWQMGTLLKSMPQAKWYQWDPVGRDSVREGARMAFGQYVETRYNLAEADIILSLDADFFWAGFPGNQRYARDWASRRVASPQLPPHADVLGNPMPIRPMNRMYMVESTPTITGGKADHKLAVKGSALEGYARLVASRLGISVPGAATPKNEWEAKFIDGLVKDLQAHRGTSVVIAGDHQPPVVHALAHAMNQLLGNAGKTVIYTDPVEQNPANQMEGLKELAADMHAGKVEILVISGVNPVFDAPADVDFAGGLNKVAGTVYHGLYNNETSARCQWHITAAHYLEAWSDARAYDGTVSIVQPLIAPLYGGKSLHEVLGAFSDDPLVSGYDLVRGYWRTQFKGNDAEFEFWWRRVVHDGLVPGTTLPPKTVQARMTFPPPTAPSQGLEIAIRPDFSINDGNEFGNNAFLQELPKQISQVVWDNPVLVGPATASKQGWKYGDVLEIQTPAGQKALGAVWVQPGVPEDSLVLYVGYGHWNLGRASNGMGFNAYPLRTTNTPHVIPGVNVRKTGNTYQLTSAQGFQDMQNRGLVRAATLEEYKADPLFAHREEHEPPRQETLYPNYDYTGYAWGMSIDHNACVGCDACIIACQVENNIPVVGKGQVARGRRMHWLRVDTYYKGDPANPQVFFQPVPCMHCENAPCEQVCPVTATVHDTEGLNNMVYNRCVGTRYCSNNCPYKVRRFNFLLFQDWTIPQFKMMRNPEVSVRSRGVMEKCTYCIQRIQHGRTSAEKQDRLIRDLEVQTACQQACPADAIVFGNINDKNSRVTQLKQAPLNYGLLTDLNTRPRTTYLAVVRNPNPEIPDPVEQKKA